MRKYALGILLVALSLIACSPIARSRAKQVADVICASIAASINTVKNDPIASRLAIACLDRLERNEAIEDAIRTSAAGSNNLPVCSIAGSAGVP
jgi:hypothetical protein